MWDRRARVLSVHDGDTLTVVLDQGFYDSKQITLRLLGVFAPELKDKGGKETRQFVLDWIDAQCLAGSNWPFVVTTARTKTDHEISTLGRYVGTLTTLDGTRNLNAEINEFVAAKGYGGGTGS